MTKKPITLLQEGDVIELTANHRVYANIPKHFVYANCQGDFSMTHFEVSLKNEHFAYLRGKYIVVRTAMNGGGPSHDGGYPDGHHVYCESLDGRHHVDFYQTGCFTAMITEEIPVLGRGVKKWVIEK